TGEVAREPPLGRRAVVGGQLRGTFERQFSRTSELVAGVDQLERVLDRGRRQQPAGQLGRDTRATETLALLQNADQVLGQRDVVDQADSLEPLDLVPDDLVRELARAEHAFELS